MNKLTKEEIDHAIGAPNTAPAAEVLRRACFELRQHRTPILSCAKDYTDVNPEWDCIACVLKDKMCPKLLSRERQGL